MMPDDSVPGTKTTTPAPDVSQQIEAHLDKLDRYTNDQLNEIVHVFIYRRPTNMVLVEYVDMTPNDSEKYITRDSLNAVMFWQGHQTLHMRKLNVRMHDATLFHHRLLWVPPRAHTGQLLCCHVNSEMILYNVTIVIWLCNYVQKSYFNWHWHIFMKTHTNCSMHVLIVRIVMLKPLLQE